MDYQQKIDVVDKFVYLYPNFRHENTPLPIFNYFAFFWTRWFSLVFIDAYGLFSFQRHFFFSPFETE